MSETRHTPGPWRALGATVYPDRDCLETLAALAICKRRQHAPTIRKAEAEANARLIAAAPELLTLARYAVDNPEFDSERFDMMARTAIAKAEGR